MVTQNRKTTAKTSGKKVSNKKPAAKAVTAKAQVKKPQPVKPRVVSAPKAKLDMTRFKEGEKEYMIPITLIRFDAEQPRKAFHAADGRIDKETQIKLNELAETIKADGLINAITLEALEDGTFKIITGERRTRAHILLGLKEIRAVIKNDISDVVSRRVHQYVENKHRQDFTYQEEYELASYLLHCGNNGNPMSLTEVANKMKKSPGDITRFLRYGDEEMQRLWIKPGIVTKRESVYKVSNFPMEIKTEILHRVSLPEDHPQHLARPISRVVIDAYETQIKQVKAARRNQVEMPPSTARTGTNNDPLDAVMGGSAQNGEEGEGSYSLSKEDREKLLTTQTQMAGNRPIETAAEMNKTPVHCRITSQNMLGLIQVIADEEELRESFNNLLCEVAVPRTLAQRLANKLAGNVVNDEEVDAVLQQSLVKLK